MLAHLRFAASCLAMMLAAIIIAQTGGCVQAPQPDREPCGETCHQPYHRSATTLRF